MRPFTLLIKPTGPDCNLDCDYCFYLKKAKLYPDSKRHIMSDEILHLLIKSYFETEQPVYTIGWQGGEPSMLGIEFFEKVISYEKQYARSGYTIGNGLQTNCTLLTDEFANFLFHNKFLVGASLDGPAYLHNTYRLKKDRSKSHSRVLEGIKHLQRHQVQFNILVLVNKANVIHAKEVYRYMLRKGFKFLQFIPCVEFDEDGNPQPFTINAKEWGNFLCDIFDLWYNDDMYTISIREFDDILNVIVDNRVTACTKGKDCCQYLLVEHNGDVYPCDFFVEKGLKIGNIMENSWKQMQESETYREFGKNKLNLNKQCVACDYVYICNGDCLKHRMYAGNPPDNLSWLCNGSDEGLKKFYAHTLERFENLSGIIRRKRETEAKRAMRER